MPLRDFVHPMGLPGLSPAEKKKVADNDLLVNFAIMALHGASMAGRFGWLEFPEDLGRCRHGVPASLWQLQAAKDLANFGYVRGALYQCEWSNANYKKPIGILTNIRTFCTNPNFHNGWPSFDGRDLPSGGPSRKYLGPLPDNCLHSGIHAPLIGRGGDGTFRTAKAAEYPPTLCKAFADPIVAALTDRDSGKIASARPPEGALHSGLPFLFPFDLLESEVKAIKSIFESLLPAGRGSLHLGLHRQRHDDGRVGWCFQGSDDATKELNKVVFELALRSGRPFLWSSLQRHPTDVAHCCRLFHGRRSHYFIVVATPEPGRVLRPRGGPHDRISRRRPLFHRRFLASRTSSVCSSRFGRSSSSSASRFSPRSSSSSSPSRTSTGSGQRRHHEQAERDIHRSGA